MPALAAKTLYDIVTRSAEETIAFGRTLAAALYPPCLVSLEGELGSGKTTLTKGIATGLGAAREEDVTSPSFTLVHEYGSAGAPLDSAAAVIRVFHVDLYRVESARDAESLGLEEMFGASAVVIIEWGEKLAHAPAVPLIRVRFESLGADERHITVEGSADLRF
ncbi:MAG: tRNA (adenosine(37)-N6)-threonylcarbamoyltransferase complex ATPase subunit type 1 TsaE [Terriglobia bacterium]